MIGPDKLGQAIHLAGAFLEAEAARGFPEARHHMSFPRWAGFGGAQAQQTSEAFGRAVIADLLLDIGALSNGTEARRWADIARAEADMVAAARLTDRVGGWSYFPDLPELPPDLDSLAAAIRVFARAAPDHLPLVEEPIQCALAGADADGGIRTWIVARENDPAALKRMRRGVRWHWGDTVDIEVCARFYLALLAMDPTRFAAEIERGAAYVAARQTPTGGWDATWYAGQVYGTALCCQLMAETGRTGAVDAGHAALTRLEYETGGWGNWQPVPLDTAIALSTSVRDHPRSAIERAVSFLIEYQNPDGSWPGTPWIKMEVGRALGRIQRTITWQSDTITTAFALRALVGVRHRLAASAEEDRSSTPSTVPIAEFHDGATGPGPDPTPGSRQNEIASRVAVSDAQHD